MSKFQIQSESSFKCQTSFRFDVELNLCGSANTVISYTSDLETIGTLLSLLHNCNMTNSIHIKSTTLIY